MKRRTGEEPCAPVEAFRWMVFFGTRWAEVTAATKDDAMAIVMGRVSGLHQRQVKARRMRPSDEERHESWRASAEQLQMSDRRWAK